MRANEIFKLIVEDPILIEKYGFTEEEVKCLSLHQKSEKKIIEAIKIIIENKENKYSQASLYNQIKRIIE